jgi:hypothetical protein
MYNYLFKFSGSFFILFFIYFSISAQDNQIIIYDTIVNEQIVYEYDTVVEYDTLYEKINNDTAFQRFFTDTNIIQKTDIINNKKKHTSFYISIESGAVYSYLLLKTSANFNYFNETDIESGINGFANIKIKYKAEKLGFNTGLNCSNNKVKYSFSDQYSNLITPSLQINETNKIILDTVDTHFQYLGSDTTWYHVVQQNNVTTYDSVYINDTTINKDFDGQNGNVEFFILSLPVSIEFDIIKRRKFTLSGYSGISIGIPIFTNGSFYSFKQNTYLNSKYILNSVTYNVQGGVNIYMQINENLFINSGLLIDYRINNLFSENYISANPLNIGLFIGLTKKI